MHFDVNTEGARRGSLTPLVLVTLFWCAITGLFVAFVIINFWRSAEAYMRYVPTAGVIFSSQVISNTDSHGTTFYDFGLRYRYTVKGAAFENDRYAFGTMKSGAGRTRAAELVRHHPVGAPITVYYDPAMPGKAVIERAVDRQIYPFLMFLMPFVLIGVGLLGVLVMQLMLPIQQRRINRFLHEPAAVPWKIPAWGLLNHGFSGFELQPKATLLGVLIATLAGFGLASFSSSFIAGSLFGDFNGGTPYAISGMLGLCVLGSVAGGVLYVRSRRNKARLVIDPTRELIMLTSPLRQVEVAFDKVAGWRLKQILNPRTWTWKQGGDAAYVPLLCIHTTKGADVPIHVFDANEQAPAVAQKVLETFAAWTNKPLFEEPPSIGADENAQAATQNVEEAFAAWADKPLGEKPPNISDVLKLIKIGQSLAATRATREFKTAAAQLKDLL